MTNYILTTTSLPSINIFSGDFFFRLGINLLSCFILIRLIYYPAYKNRDYFFAFIVFNLLIFLITSLLNQVEMSMGAAFGLFAVFSMLRYRTEGLSMKDMTYLFLVIAMGLITAVAVGSWIQVALLNLGILVLTYLLEANLFIKIERSKIIQYEKIDLIKPENRLELLADLEQRTGLKINRYTVGDIDFLKDTAVIVIYYRD